MVVDQVALNRFGVGAVDLGFIYQKAKEEGFNSMGNYHGNSLRGGENQNIPGSLVTMDTDWMGSFMGNSTAKSKPALWKSKCS